MKTLWTYRDIDAPAESLWSLLTDLDTWPVWGPTVRRVELHGDHFEPGATGTVTTVGGVSLGFEITSYAEGSRWGWKVGGIAATDHTVESLGAQKCRVGFGVPWVAAPYLGVCQLALHRLNNLANEQEVSP